jgi:hypothetical protein
MRQHAILAPSSSERWMICPPSARQEAKEPYSSSIEADRGTLAHSLAELLIKQHLHETGEQKMNDRELSEDEEKLQKIFISDLYDNDMMNHCINYKDFVIEQLNIAKEEDSAAAIFLESKLLLDEFIPEGFGRADVIIISSIRLHGIDFKYGRGLVSPIQNSQLKIYALGALIKYDFLFTPQCIYLTIYQPRIFNFETWETKRDILFSWGYAQLKPAAALAFKGEGDYHPGDNCHFCKIAYKCRALADFNLQIAQHEFADASLLTTDEIADILSKAKIFITWLEAIQEHALEQATKHAKHWPGFKLVEGKTNRIYKDEKEVELKLLASQFKPAIIYKPKELWGIGEMEKRLGEQAFKEYLGELITKPKGNLKLVPESDPKEEYNSLEKAQQQFLSYEELGERKVFTENPDSLI